MKEIRYRLAKPSDAKQIAAIHYGIREQYDVGIFARLGKPFLRRYYSIMLNDPWEVVVCAEKRGTHHGLQQLYARRSPPDGSLSQASSGFWLSEHSLRS